MCINYAHTAAKRITYYEYNSKDSIKPPTEVEVVKHQVLDQFKREHIQNSISHPTE